MLSIVGDVLIVCAGAAEDIIALDISTGEQKWRLPAIWEYQRGFIGPSVWQHFISRFAVDHLPDDQEILDEDYRKEVRETKKRMAEQRKQLAQTCRIVGGPAAIPTPQHLQKRYYKCSNCGKYHGTKPSQQHRVFVAVSKATGGHGGYLADCIIYEIDEKGEPIALVNMPRMVLGSQFHVHGGGVVWRCEQEAVAKLVPSEQSRSIGMGPGGTDCIARLAWYLQPPSDPGRADTHEDTNANWLMWTKAVDAVCFDGNTMFRLAGGGSIRAAADRTMRFPISRTALPGGKPQTMTLCVPFKGKPSLPSANYGSFGDSTFSYRPLYLSIVGLEAMEQHLTITVSAEDGRQTMLFFKLGQ